MIRFCVQIDLLQARLWIFLDEENRLKNVSFDMREFLTTKKLFEQLNRFFDSNYSIKILAEVR